MSGRSPAEIEAALVEVAGVSAAEVLAEGPEGGEGLLKLTLDPRVNESDVASLVAQVLRGFDLLVDVEGVQLAHDAGTPSSTPASPGGAHLQLVPGSASPAGPAVPHVAAQIPPEHSPRPSEPPDLLETPIFSESQTARQSPPDVGRLQQSIGDPPLVDSTGMSESRPEPKVTRSARIRFDRFGVTNTGLDVSAEVVLSGPAGPATGAATCPATPSGVLRAAAEATCEALGRLGPVRVDLEQVMESVAGTNRYILVEVVMLTEGSQIGLVGAARVRDDARQAAARAVLAAVNRRMGALIV